ncbi:MAG: YqiA/YcfP family alpha/beta fold hydrolase [Janthinobacterium lividum]
MILYLHGFRSSPQSFKARMLGARLAELGHAGDWVCPQLPVSPKAAIELAEWIATRSATPPLLIGSSLGGFYATWLAEKYHWRAVLINPATEPEKDLDRSLGEQTLWHGGGTIVVEAQHLEELRELAVAKISPERYYLLAATGDEVLDYRDMLKKYAGARTTLIQGSDHGLSDFAAYIDGVLDFCGIDSHTEAHRGSVQES